MSHPELKELVKTNKSMKTKIYKSAISLAQKNINSIAASAYRTGFGNTNRAPPNFNTKIRNLFKLGPHGRLPKINVSKFHRSPNKK